MTKQLHFHFSLSCIGEGNGNPLQCSCLENPRDGGAWWAAICRVTQSRTRLKRPSSSSSSLLSQLPKSWKFSNVSPLSLFLSFSNMLTVLLHFHINFIICLPNSWNNLLGFWLELHWLYRSSWKEPTAWFMLSLPIHEHGTSFHFSKSYLIEFISFIFSSSSSYIYFLRFIHKYFILVSANVNCILFSNSTFSLLVCRKAVDLCI